MHGLLRPPVGALGCLPVSPSVAFPGSPSLPLHRCVKFWAGVEYGFVECRAEVPLPLGLLLSELPPSPPYAPAALSAYRLEPGVEYRGHDLKGPSGGSSQLSTPSPAACAAACSATARCRAWFWQDPNQQGPGTCSLKACSDAARKVQAAVAPLNSTAAAAGAVSWSGTQWGPRNGLVCGKFHESLRCHGFVCRLTACLSLLLLHASGQAERFKPWMGHA